jgi:DNA-binding transcriptional LysR family regulator
MTISYCCDGTKPLEVSPSALSQAIRHLEARLGARLLNRTTRSVSLTEAGEAYLSRIGPALSDVLEAGEQLHALQGQPSGVLRINAARISTAMVLQPMLAGFLTARGLCTTSKVSSTD